MANVIGTTPGVLIGMGILVNLLEEWPWLRQITTDFSAESSLLNQPIKIQSPNALTAGDYNDTDGYVPQDVSQTEYDLVINKHKHVTYGFSDTERSKHDIALIDRFARNGSHAIGKALVDDLLALVKNNPFTHKTIVATAASMDSGKIITINKAMTGRKIPKSGRFMILNSPYYASLCEDSRFVSNPGSPAGTVRSGELGNVFGISTSEYAFLPDNGENLAGFAATAEALLLATRLPTPPDVTKIGGTIEVITHPETKLSLQLRQWYDFRFGKEFRTYTLQYGVGTGDPERLERIAAT